ncbi:YajQ family cyclic di-GMP-binding protein [Nonomuraea sp. CA-143628]|uniref:YajQ family cyclic di-GMP-binding protein n=1 Tax=Nonomuraea sp. CA-143628 TaxID=3239997 RepID=UPI003D8F7D91
MCVLADSSFDIVSKIDRQEVDNALNQTVKEIGHRFDFKGTGASISWSGQSIEIKANSEERAGAALDVFKEKVIKRGLSLKIIDADEPKLSGREYRMLVSLKEGIDQENAKKISKMIRDEGPKGVKAQIQGEELRVSSKKKDDLQEVMSMLKGKDLDIALQFVNYR